MKSRTVKWAAAFVTAVILVVAGAIAGREGFVERFVARARAHKIERTHKPAHEYHVEIVRDRGDTIRVSAESFQALNLRTVEVEPAPPPEPLRLPGRVVIDPNRLLPVHSRFTGELVRIGTVKEGTVVRPLRYGDRVTKGDLMGVVWSKEIGEKKSELVDAQSKLDADRKTLEAMERAVKGAVAEMKIIEARRNVQADQIALFKADRTLRSWRLTEDEIRVVYQEAEDVQKGESDPENDKSWAELEIRAPISGMVIEKNVNEGAMVDPDDILFQVADLSRLMVEASAYEEDLPALRRLDPAHRSWKIDLKSDPYDQPIEGTFSTVGPIIDPKVHTGVVLGWVDNTGMNLAAGQFITATIELPADPALVVIPTAALIEEGGASYVFVETDAEHREFARRKISVRRRGRRNLFVCGDSAPSGRGCGAESLGVGERVIVTNVLELSAELDSAKSRHEARETQ